MTSDEFLFEDPAGSSPAGSASITNDLVAAWQIRLIRDAFATRNVNDMAARQHLVESVAARPVSNIRELTRVEGNRVLEALAQPTRGSRSAWDDRDEDTWIDRM